MNITTVAEAMRRAVREIQGGDASLAVTICRDILRQDSGQAAATHVLGLALIRLGRREEALDCLRRCAEASPASVEFQQNLGSLLGEMGRTGEAVEAFRVALQLRPKEGRTQGNLSVALGRLGRWNEAVIAAWRAATLEPRHAPRWRALGAMFKSAGRPVGTLAAYRRAAGLEPMSAEIQNSLATAWMDEGYADRGIAHYRRAVELRPDVAAYQSNLLYALLHSPHYGTKELLDEHRLWNDRHAVPLEGEVRSHHLYRPAERRCRVGFISADFRQHAQACFLEPPIRGLDRTVFDVFCYSDVLSPDPITARFRAMEVQWREIAGMKDHAVAEMVRADQIDILIDATGHMGGNRLLVFARKPAPIQIAFSTYPGTTGLTAIDYFLTDPVENPIGCDESNYSERLLRLPHCARCYQPPTEAKEPGEPPIVKNGYPTFGAFNRPSKVTPEAVDAWANILQALPTARLLVLTGNGRDGRPMRWMHRRFNEAGMAGRVEYVGRRPRREYFDLFDRIDVALDTFPYAGCTTTCDALWMGVPVVALNGPTMASRAGATLLSHAGLSDLVAAGAVEYQHIAVSLVGNVSRLKEWRRSLRFTLKHGAADGGRFGRELGEALKSCRVLAADRSVNGST